jgi:pantothenate kinase
MDLSIAQAIAIDPKTPVVVVEGNYLLLDAEPWNAIHQLYSASVFVCPTEEELRERLVQRWVKHGFGPEAARQRANQNDLPNAELVMRESVSADLRLDTQNCQYPPV